MKAPFPYFGGKSAVSNIVWQALGQPAHYMEPFFGSGAVLLSRPGYDPAKHTETVNDKDGHICNVWRALQSDPDAVAKVCDWPINHADLSARKLRLIKEQDALLAKLIADDKYYHVELAGYWIWATSCWIGDGMLSVGKRPHLADAGKGVHAIGKRPHLADAGRGVHTIGKVPHLANAGRGVHTIGQVPHLGDAGMGVSDQYNVNIFNWFRELSERLRRVRVVCGDWQRVCGGNWQNCVGDCGMFFDPPYSDDAKRKNNLYAQDSLSVAHDVRMWCIERAANKDYRIVLAGYTGEHEELSNHGWTFQKWKAQSGYSNVGKCTTGKDNRNKEILWLSPHCNISATQLNLI